MKHSVFTNRIHAEKVITHIPGTLFSPDLFGIRIKTEVWLAEMIKNGAISDYTLFVGLSKV
jgi:hypothetical protein